VLKKYLVEQIKDKDWKTVIQSCQSLTDGERLELIKLLKDEDTTKDIFDEVDRTLGEEERAAFYENQSRVRKCYYLALLACTRNYSDLKQTESKVNGRVLNPLRELLCHSDYVALEAFFKLFPPDYLDKVIQEMAKDKFRIVDFRTLWRIYELGWVSFDEAYFTRSLFTIQMFNRNTKTDTDFLAGNEKAFHQVFLVFYRNEVPVLDISKWQAREGFVCKKVYEYWTEVIILLNERGIVFDRSIIKNLLESLLNNWKKGHLDWHTRLLEFFHPTEDELLEHQTLLFALFGTNNPSLINFALRNIQTIRKAKRFNGLGFIENFALCFSNDKCIKAIFSGLDIVENVLTNPDYKDVDFSERLAVLLMHADANLQMKTATLLRKFTNAEDLNIIAAPYTSYLKQKTKDTLSISSESTASVNADIAETKQVAELAIASNWDELLFQIGNCIHTKSATDIDLLLEGINQLQNQIPVDLEKQLKPYTKQLFNRSWENHVMAYFSLFIEGWINEKEIDSDEGRYDPIPFLKNKCNRLIEKLKKKNRLPFLSTPTHRPFFIHPTALVKRVLAYEEVGGVIFYEDLIVACNRTWFKNADNESRTLAKKMKGKYAKALSYFLGVSDKIEPTEETLALWAQVTRIRNPDAVFTEFDNTSAREYPSVIHPLMLDFRIHTESNQYATWHKMMLGGNWNKAWYLDQEPISYDHIFYNVSTLKKASRIDIPYQLSLNPNYVDGQISRYIPNWTTGNEVDGFESCLFPLQFLVENKIETHHSGWIYIAACLMFEKKISRELAGEYIEMALVEQHKDLDYLADLIGSLTAQKFGPVNRLLEFFDKPNTNHPVNAFKFKVLGKCLEYFDMQQLPANSKKVVEYYEEWVHRLGVKGDEELLAKVKTKKK